MGKLLFLFQHSKLLYYNELHLPTEEWQQLQVVVTTHRSGAVGFRVGKGYTVGLKFFSTKKEAMMTRTRKRVLL